MKRTLLFVALVCFIFFATLTSFSTNHIVQDVLSQTNQFRKSKGLSELIMRKELNAIAQKHSVDMASGRVPFGHSGFGHRNALATKNIKAIHHFGENVAYGATSGKDVVAMWKSSPGHRRNMLGTYKYIGIGVARDRYGRLYYTQVFAG